MSSSFIIATYLDNLPTTGNAEGRAFRDLEMEQKILEICQKSGIGAQFGGKYPLYVIIIIYSSY